MSPVEMPESAALGFIDHQARLLVSHAGDPTSVASGSRARSVRSGRGPRPAPHVGVSRCHITSPTRVAFMTGGPSGTSTTHDPGPST